MDKFFFIYTFLFIRKNASNIFTIPHIPAYSQRYIHKRTMHLLKQKKINDILKMLLICLGMLLWLCSKKCSMF